jgi:hypothetical protein
MRLCKMLAVTGVLLASSVTVRGQAVYGNIVGTVFDPTGAAIPGATIKITDVNRNTTVSTTSNGSGNFEKLLLLPSTYTVEISKDGFSSFQIQNVIVSVDRSTPVNAALQVGNATQRVDVTSEAPPLTTDRAEISTTYAAQTVSQLPIINRQFSEFELLTAGFVATGNQPVGEDPQHSYNKLVNGQLGAGMSETIDGTDNHSALLGTVMINPTLESVAEAKVTTADYSAEFSGGTGVVNVETRSGTNSLHGSGFEFLRNDHMQARDPFTQSKPIPGSNGRTIPVTQWNDFGGAISGPLKKDKLFYFFDYQGQQSNQGGASLVRTPTAPERLGQLSDLNITIYDPNSGATPALRTPFPGNTIPTSELSPQALNLLALMPLPNYAAAALQPNYIGSGVYHLGENTENTRWDYIQNEKVRWFGRYSDSLFPQRGPATYGPAAGGPALVAGTFAGTSNVFNQDIAGGFDYILSPNVLTDFRVGFYRQHQVINQLEFGTPVAANAGIPGVNNDIYSTQSPTFVPAGNGGFSEGSSLSVSSCNCPIREIEKQIQFVNNWTIIHGNHTLKFGEDIRRAWNFRLPSDVTRAGQFTFDTAVTEGPSGGGAGLATMLLGDVSTFGRYVTNPSAINAAEQQNRWFFYGQDSWRVNKKLTFNYGLRWELYRPQTVNGQGMGGFVNITTGEVEIAGENGVGLNLNVAGTEKALAPRVGIAYQIDSKTVIRTGYIRAFDQGVFGNIFGHNVTQNPPVLGSQAVTPAFNYQSIFTLAEGPPAFNPETLLDQQPLGPHGEHILPNTVNAFINPPKIIMQTVDQWNFTIQRQLPGNFVLETAYVGNKGTHVGGNYNFNTATIVGFPTLSTFQREPFYAPFGWTQAFRYNGNDMNATYEALQVTVQKRFSKGLSMFGNYTFGRGFAYSGTYFSVNSKDAYEPNASNRKQVLHIGPQWEVPVGKGKRFLANPNRVVNAFLGGWQMNGIFTHETGLPFTPTYTDCSADIDTGPCKPNYVGGAVYPANKSQNGWFNVASTLLSTNGQTSGVWQRPQIATFGNIGLLALVGPNFWEADMSAFKSFNVTERIKLQFRAEALNALNHENLGQPTATVDSIGTAGKIFATSPYAIPKKWQMDVRLQF